MDNTVREVLEFVRQNDVKFIRLAFCDLFGMQKNISVMPDELARAFNEGISFDGSSIRGFSDVTRSDLFLHPDPATITVLPWRPQQGRVVRFFCDITSSDGTPFVCDTRAFLKEAVNRCEAMGFTPKIGAECEFYLFKTDENGSPLRIPFDEGGYLDIAPLDKGENVRREICLCLEEMGIKPETSHHESGPGQNEIDFKYCDALEAADSLITFKSVVKAISSRNGLFASFLPKPLADESGSGLHINLSLSKNGRNIFNDEQGLPSDTAKSFIAGILYAVPELTAFLNPIPNSYERFGSFEAPKYVSWSHENRSQLVRIPAATGEGMRMELRSPDPSLNPYLAFGLLLHAGLNGIEQGAVLPEPLDQNLYSADASVTEQLTALPDSLADAVDTARQSAFIASFLPQEMFIKYLQCKETEAMLWEQDQDKETYRNRHYFKQY